MTSCPDDRELLELVDGELRPEREFEVVDHLAECADCRLALGRAEAALDFALGGLADTGRWSPRSVTRASPAASPAPGPAALNIRAMGIRAPGVCALATAATLLVALAVSSKHSDRLGGDSDAASLGATPRQIAELEPSAELHMLLARAEQLRDAVVPAHDGRDLLAAGALAAAEVRAWTVGPGAARARVRDVVERFPGTPAARDARALLASAACEDAR